MRPRAAAALAILLACSSPAWADEPRGVPSERAPRRTVLRPPVVEVVAVEAAAVLRLRPGSTETLRAPRPAQTVVVGDPAIVEASLTNETTILLVPKAVGVTNLILFDEDGDEFLRRTIQVGAVSKPILVYSGERVQPYDCAPICNRPPEPVPPPSAVFTTNINGVPAGSAAPSAAAAPASPAPPAGAAAPPAAAPR